MDLDFDTIFKTTILAMKLNRSHPSIKRDRKWIIQFTLMHGIATIVLYLLIHSIVYHDLKINDFSATCRNGCLCVVYFVVTLQYCVMLKYQNVFIDIIKIMQKHYEMAKTLPVDEQNIMLVYAKKGSWVCKQWVLISVIGCSLFPIKNIILYIYYYMNDDFKFVPLYELTYPNFIEENKNSISVYVITYAILLFFDMYAAVMYLAFVPLGPMFMLHSCGQLELVKKRAENVFNGSEEESNEKLKSIVVQLQHIYSFVEHINECFGVVYELTLKATTIILPITCYEVIESLHRREMSLEFITFIVGGTIISSSPCFYSDLLMEKGEEVRLAVYSCGWERRCERGARVTLLVVLQRALRPVAIRTMFRTVCLDALTDLLQQSYGIFNLMNAMWN